MAAGEDQPQAVVLDFLAVLARGRRVGVKLPGEIFERGVETGPAARIAQQGVTPKNFPAGTIVTVTLNPLRNGKPFGAMPNGTPIVHCGTTMPKGGCTAETGKTYLGQNN